MILYLTFILLVLNQLAPSTAESMSAGFVQLSEKTKITTGVDFSNDMNQSSQNCRSILKTDEMATHRKYKDLEDMRECHRIPHMQQNYVPQGLYINKKNIAYISLYHKDKYKKSTLASEVIEYNLENSEIQRVYKLFKDSENIYKGHVGGVAVYDKYSKFAIVSEGTKICVFDVNKSTKISENKSKSRTSKKIYKLPLLECQEQNIGTTSSTTGFSFVQYAKDHNGVWHMWVGQFKTANNSNQGMHIFAYPVTKGKISQDYNYRFYVPKSVHQIQGMAVLKAEQGYYEFILSRSFGNTPSELTKVAYVFDSERKVFKYRHLYSGHLANLPSGSEGIVAKNKTGEVWTLFESGANYFQKRSKNPWEDNYPFLIKLKIKN